MVSLIPWNSITVEISEFLEKNPRLDPRPMVFSKFSWNVFWKIAFFHHSADHRADYSADQSADQIADKQYWS